MTNEIIKKLVLFLVLIPGFIDTACCQEKRDSLQKDSVTQVHVNKDFGVKDTMLVQEPLYRLNRAFLVSFVTDGKYLMNRPFHWKRKDWARLSIAAAVTGGVLASDWELRNVFRHNQTSFNSKASSIVEPFGNFYGLYIFPAMYVVGVLTKQRKIESVGLGGAKSLLISTIVYTVAKKVVRRRRPDEASSSFDFALPFTKKGYTSSPSGHSNTIFTVATALALEYRNIKWLPPVLYMLAGLTAVSRIYQNRHWSSDILVGSLLGHFVTRAVWRNSNQKRTIRRLPV